jgi:hypothetical protein
LLLFLQKQNGDLEQEQASLDAQLSTIEARRKEIGNVKEQIQKTQEETQALAGVFNTIKPPSALMQDIRDRTPASVQISNIKQVPPTPGTPQPAASPNASPNPKAPPVHWELPDLWRCQLLQRCERLFAGAAKIQLPKSVRNEAAIFGTQGSGSDCTSAAAQCGAGRSQ